ncbi:MAG: substrate-binding domain-containing protein [Lentisphaeria bacterium]|nr:substrate-binding domain-containing protein [Lentisphaeria bacterium]
MKKVTVHDVAEHAGVSPATVSRVINRRPEVSEEATAAVVRAAEELGYRLRPRRRNIGLILPLVGVTNFSFWSDTATAIGIECFNRGYRLEIVHFNDIELLSERAISGVIDLSAYDRTVDVWPEFSRIPLVRINARSDNRNAIYSVLLDGERAVEQAFAYLESCGHTRIGLISFESREYEEKKPSRRLQGIFRSMQRRRVRSPEKCCVFCNRFAPEPPSDAELEREIVRLIRRGFSAFICTSGLEIARAIQVINRAGYRIPEDISIVGYELPDRIDFISPVPSEINICHTELARHAMEMLEALTSGSGPVSDRLVPYSIVHRDSVGVFRNEKKSCKNEQKILDRLKKNPELTIAGLCSALSLHPSTVKRRLLALRERGLLRREGGRKKGKWLLAEFD